jgi:hypothetical protein
LSSFRWNVLIVLLLPCAAAPAARSQGVAVSAPDVPGVENAVPGSSGHGLYSADAAADAAVLAAVRWRAVARDEGALAGLAQRLGDLKVIGPALLAGYVTGRVRGVPDLSASSARVAGATVGGALLCGGLQSAAGSRRGLAGGKTAGFPSSRSSVAFAAAAAVDAESRPTWVRWVVYPAAAGVAVADARGSGQGPGTTLAGAALGLVAGHVLDRIERDRVSLFERAHFLARGSRRDFRVGFQARF